MQKKAISLILISTFVFSVILGACTISPVLATSKILHVPTQYPTIQAAINAANSGDTVYVYNRTYHENIVVNKTITLVGENPSNTIIDGSGTGADAVRVAANNVRIENLTIQKGDSFEPTSLVIWNSRNHTISNNIIRQSYYGLKIQKSNDSRIVNNVITGNTGSGIKFSSSSSRNNVIGNLIENNAIGIWIADENSKNNTFYHNNFIDNTNQASSFAQMNFWSNGAEGNYWSDYKGQDTNGDGIGDTTGCNAGGCTPHLGLDFFPLVDKWSDTRDFSVMWKGVTYHTVISRNSTIASFNFTYSLAQISFNATGPQNTIGFCNVTIDKSFLDGNFAILVNRVSKAYISTYNSTHTSLYFTFSHSTHEIQIRGTKVVGNSIPVANFTYSPKDPKENQEIQFNDISTDLNGNVTDWLWDFGDGNESFQQNPVHRFTKKGTYNVTLTVKDNGNLTNTLTETIAIASSLPDYTLYYVLIGITSAALILGAALLLLKKKKKTSSSKKITK